MDCRWQHPRSPSARQLGEERATENVLEHLGDTRVGCRVSSGRIGVEEGRAVEDVPGSGGEEGGPDPP